MQASKGGSAAASLSARLRRQSGPPAASAASSSSPPSSPLAAAAVITPQPAAQPEFEVVSPQAAAQAPSHASLPPLDPNLSPDRAEASLPSAGAATSSTPAPGPTTQLIAMSLVEYHADYATVHPSRGRKNASMLVPASPQAQQPVVAGTPTEQPEVSCPSTPPVPVQSASYTSVASASSSTTVGPTQRFSKSCKSQPRKRRAEDPSPVDVSVTKQASTSVPVMPYPVNRAISKTSATVTYTSTALCAEPPTAVPKTARSATHADLR